MPRHPVTRLVVIVAAALLWTHGARAAAPVFRAGAATANITPSIAPPTTKTSRPPAVTVHDELQARCLVLDDGSTRLAFVVCDLRHMSAEVAAEAKKIIAQTTGITHDHISISATHTHTSGGNNAADESRIDDPYNEYRVLLARRIADAVLIAVNNLEPARIGWGVAEEPTSVFNRRWFLKSGPVMGPHGTTEQVGTNPGYKNLLKPAGPVDPQISFISVQSTTGKPIGLLASYGLHYVGGGIQGAISADYFAVFADRVGQLLGADRQDPPFVGIMANGTSGDVNNLERYPDGQAPTTPRKKYQPYEKAREVAYLCADKVMEVHKTIQFHDHVTLSSVERTLTFQTRKPTPEELAWAKLVKAKKAKPTSTSKYSTYNTILKYAEPDFPPTVDVIIQAYRVGDIAIAAMPFEVFAEIGLELKQRSPIKPMFSIELANGAHGYLPTPEQHKLGSYETWIGVNHVQLDASRIMTEALLEMLAELKPK